MSPRSPPCSPNAACSCARGCRPHASGRDSKRQGAADRGREFETGGLTSGFARPGAIIGEAALGPHRSVTVEELVHRPIWAYVEMVDVVVREGRSVRADAANVESERAVDCCAVLVEAAPNGEMTREARQARVSSGTALKVPVCVKVAWTRPSANTVSCSTRLVVVVMVKSGPPPSQLGLTSTKVSTRPFSMRGRRGGRISKRWRRRQQQAHSCDEAHDQAIEHGSPPSVRGTPGSRSQLTPRAAPLRGATAWDIFDYFSLGRL